MMKTKCNIFRAVLIAAAVFCTAEVSAQGIPSLFGKERANSRDRSSDIPTTITAMSMDVDMGKNIATLLGDVFVDDQEMTIRCEKMLIFFEDKKKADNTAKDGAADKDNAAIKVSAADKEKSSDPQEMAGGKRPVKIECYTNVVIQAKQKPAEDGKPPKEQKATAEKAVYDLVKDEITLTGDAKNLPVIYDGDSKVTGTKIIIIINEERMIVLRGTASTKEALKKK